MSAAWSAMRYAERRVVAAAALCLLAGAARASCHAASGNLSFGPYDPLGSAGASSSGVVAIHCAVTPVPTVRVKVTPSAVSGSFVPRRMRQTAGQETLEYNLYLDPGGYWVWGDGSGGTLTLSESVPPGKPWLITIYAKIPPRQDVTPGTYVDTIGIEIDF